MLHYIYRENVVNYILKRCLTAVGPFSCNKSHLDLPERHFSSDILVPFPDLSVLYSHDKFIEIKSWLKNIAVGVVKN